MARQQQQRPLVGFDRNGDFVFYTDDPMVRDLANFWRYHPDGAMAFLRYMWPETFEEDARKVELGLMTQEQLDEEHTPIVWTKQRREYIRHLSDPQYPLQYDIAYRGFAKSTIKRGEMARKIIFRLIHFGLWTTVDKIGAAYSTEAVRRLLMHPNVKRWFGDMRPQSNDGMKEDWGEASWQVCDPITGLAIAAVAPVSYGQVVNGKNCLIGHETHRPDYIVSDDAEDRRFIENEQLRKEYRNWVVKVLLKCVPPVKPKRGCTTWSTRRGRPAPWQAHFSDTPKHVDCHIAKLKSHKTWHGHTFPRGVALYDEAGNIVGFESLCAPEMDGAQIMQMYEDALAHPEEPELLEAFWTEDMCDVTHRSEMCFPAPDRLWFYNDKEHGLNHSEHVFRFITSDPSETFKGCKYAAHAYAVDAGGAVVYGRKRFCKNMRWDEYVRELITLAQSTNTHVVYVEGLNSKDMLRSMLESATRIRGARITFKHLKTATRQYAGNDEYGNHKDAAKLRRGANAARLFMPSKTHPAGHVCLDESWKGSQAISAMASFPNCAEWEDIDCLGHVTQVLAAEKIRFQYQPETEEERLAIETEEQDYDPAFAAVGVSDDW